MISSTPSQRTVEPGKPGALVCLRPQAEASMRLVCFPHAGGGPGSFRGWPMLLSPQIEMWIAILPGRASRSQEPCTRSWPDLLADLTGAIESQAEEPPALLGHSLGGLVAYEVARELECRGVRPLRHLFVLSCGAPHRHPRDWRWIPEDDDHLVDEVDTRYGAVPQVVRDEPELLARFAPILRADLELAAAYQWTAGPRLRTPITAFAGLGDKSAPLAEVERWRDHTDGDFRAVTLSGAHFVASDELQDVAHLMRRALEL